MALTVGSRAVSPKAQIVFCDYSLITCEQPSAMMAKMRLEPGDEVYLILRLRWLKTITSEENFSHDPSA